MFFLVTVRRRCGLIAGLANILNRRISQFFGKCTIIQLIHSADPQSQPVVIIVVCRYVCTFVTTFQNLAKQNKVQAFTTGEIVGLAEWIIDDTSIVFLFSAVSCSQKPVLSYYVFKMKDSPNLVKCK